MGVKRIISCSIAVASRLGLSLMALGASGLFSVASENSADIVAQMPVRGVVRSSAQATISTDLATIITKIGFREGEKFTKGDVLITLDCRRLRAELAAAQARYRETEVVLEATTFLNKKNAGSRQDMETSRARSDQARAEAQVIETQIDRCSIVAPYDGRVAELGAHEYEMTVAGKSLISLVSLHRPKLELIVPSTWLMWLKAGTRFRFHIDETQSTHVGEVTLLASSVDTVSQTIKVFAKFTGPTDNILPGMSGTAEFGDALQGGLRE